MRLCRLVVVTLCMFSTGAIAQQVPAPVFTDPPADAAHPAAMTVLHIPSHGVLINGLIYQPSGPGPHPTLILCHGLPGNEKNLDLAQAVRRAGWNAVTFNYRGSWGSPGVFRFTQVLEDADAVLAFLREPATAARLGIDVKRMVLAGHSMGGWVVLQTAAHDHGLLGVVCISSWDPGRAAEVPPATLASGMAGDMESLAGVTAESMAAELQTHAAAFRLENAVSGLIQVPLLALTSNDGNQSHTDTVVRAIQAKGGRKVTAMHTATDHSWSDHRIALQSMVVTWLAGLP